MQVLQPFNIYLCTAGKHRTIQNNTGVYPRDGFRHSTGFGHSTQAVQPHVQMYYRVPTTTGSQSLQGHDHHRVTTTTGSQSLQGHDHHRVTTTTGLQSLKGHDHHRVTTTTGSKPPVQPRHILTLHYTSTAIGENSYDGKRVRWTTVTPSQQKCSPWKSRTTKEREWKGRLSRNAWCRLSS